MIPRVRLAHLPTPVEPMLRLARALHGPRLWVKRDDQTGFAMGGNKTRKLEFVLAEAQANGARTLITTGAIQSNHCRQTAALAARIGMKCILVLSGEPGEVADGNLLIDYLLGAEIVWSTRAERETRLQETFAASWEAGERPYLIPLGASTATGVLGYAFAFDELLQQDVNPDWIIVASSSAGTQAGLVLGACRAGWQGKILGISIQHPQAGLQERVAALATEASDRLGGKILFSPAEILVNDSYLGEGYSIMGVPEKEAIRLFAMNEGLLLDPVYTGRAAAGMIDLIRQGFFREQDTVLFWHTGGTPALFSAQYASQLV
jgi:D-cysteine desulfhydrase family pyridoxal phosphate-dependent enzyme